MADIARHLDRCNSGRDTAGRVALRRGAARIGWLTPAVAAALGDTAGFARDAAGLRLDAADSSAALAAAAAALAGRGLARLRGEMFDVRETPDGPALAVLDRGAVPAFGVIGQGVHLNGLVRRADGLFVWVGIRAHDKATAPGQLDHLVAGGITAGYGPWATLVKEADEEASLPAALVAGARPVGRIAYVMAQAGGVRRDVLHCYDLELPADFTPRPNDDEVERFELWPAARLLAAVRETETVKFNVNLVLMDLFLREGLIDPASAEGQRLRQGLAAPL